MPGKCDRCETRDTSSAKLKARMKTLHRRRDRGVCVKVGQPQRDRTRVHRDEGQLSPGHLPPDLQRGQPDKQGRDNAEPLTQSQS